jgi:AmmeMemoRadiSam system protein A
MTAFQLSEEDRQALLATARRAIEARLLRAPVAYPKGSETLQTPCGAFVTLKAGEALRGCIGMVTASKPLVETVKEMATASAFEDPRFPPLGSDELARIRIEISVLSPLVRIADVREIEVGTHGIMLRQGRRSGLLLPQVATEYGWDRDTFLGHTCRKAGLPEDAWRDPQTVIEIFSAVVFHEERMAAERDP